MGLYMEISRVPLSTVVSKHKVHLSSRFSQILFDAHTIHILYTEDILAFAFAVPL